MEFGIAYAKYSLLGEFRFDLCRSIITRTLYETRIELKFQLFTAASMTRLSSGMLRRVVW
jgi:hypothetical protein